MVKRKAPGRSTNSHVQHFSPDLAQDADYWSFGVQQPVASKSSDSREVLFVEAIEADLIHHQESVARSLEFYSNPEEKGGSGLMRWVVGEVEDFQVVDEQAEGVDHRTEEPSGSGSHGVWVDRYDARLLLSSLPSPQHNSTQPIPTSPSRYSPTGWSDLPSDTEEMFFFTPSETTEFRRVKRRRLIEQDREERLRALNARENDNPDDNGGSGSPPWGGSDEEPDSTQCELMHRTAEHLLNSPNSALLEMRILANHGADRRFAFLRGRWKRAWMDEKKKVREEQQKTSSAVPAASSKATQGSLMDLNAYGGSDSEGGDAIESPTPDEGVQDKISQGTRDEPLPSESESASQTDERLKEARRAKAREWIANRRAKQTSS